MLVSKPNDHESFPVPIVSSSPIPSVLAQLGPLDAEDVADLRPYLRSVPDPRSRRGRWYPLVSILLILSAAALSGAKTIEEAAEWDQCADAKVLAVLEIRPHLLG